MKTTVINKGDRVYNLQGDAAEAVTPFEQGWMVRPMYETFHGDEEGYELGPPEFWKEVFTVVPIQKKCDEIAKLDETISEKKAEIAQLSRTRNEIVRMERDEKIRFDRLSKRKSILQNIEDVLDGKITHYVKANISDWKDTKGMVVQITEAASERSGDEKYERELKLLALFGKSNGDLEYRLNQYSDGTGGWYLAWPFRSQEDAESFAKEKVATQVADWRNDPTDQKRMVSTIIRNLKQFKMDVPDDLEGAQTAAILKEKQDILVRALESLAKAQEELTKAEREAL